MHNWRRCGLIITECTFHGFSLAVPLNRKGKVSKKREWEQNETEWNETERKGTAQNGTERNGTNSNGSNRSRSDHSFRYTGKGRKETRMVGSGSVGRGIGTLST